ncbi:MAG TPA: hypothetical protein VMU69_03955 [Bradyrhizobium sp.]|nr:hypothetical protein [Bradyrhizobium sp.]
MRTLRLATALSIAGAMSLASYVPAQAAPIAPLSVAAKPDTQGAGSAIQVRWGGRGWGGGWGWGWGVGALAAGALVGAAIANSSPYYYGGYYPYGGYGGPYYGYGYGYPYGGYSVPYYPAYGYGYYRAYPRYYAGYRPYWRNSYGMYRVYRRW